MSFFRFILFVMLLTSFFVLTVKNVKAQDGFSGGTSSNLTVKAGDLQIQEETIDIKLHIGFAQVKQNYTFINNQNNAQGVVYGFSYQPGQINSGVDNIQILVDSNPVETNTTTETGENGDIYWKLFQSNIEPNQIQKIQVSYWQTNSANLRGMRGFNYQLKNTLSAPIGKLNLELQLADGISLDSFNKTINPDLDLKLEPLGWKKNDTSLNWIWTNIQPSFNIQANFYWPKGDLAKISDLSQPIGLYNISSDTNSKDTYKLSDSSYLTSWLAPNPFGSFTPTIDFDFGAVKRIESISFLSGALIDSRINNYYSQPKEIEISFDKNKSEKIILQNSTDFQEIHLKKPVDTKQATVRINSIYPGTTDTNNLAISEIEFFSKPEVITADQTVSQSNQPKSNKFSQFFINIWSKIINFIKYLF